MAEEMMTKAAAMPNRATLTMVERVARAIWAKSTELIPEGDRVPWEEVNYCFQADILDQARAAIEVMREPTPTMVQAMALTYDDEAVQAWCDAIDAALSEDPLPSTTGIAAA